MSKKQGMEQSEALHGALKHLPTLSQSLFNPSHDEGQKVWAASPLWTMEAKEHSENGRTLADTPPKSSEMAFIILFSLEGKDPIIQTKINTSTAKAEQTAKHNLLPRSPYSLHFPLGFGCGKMDAASSFARDMRKGLISKQDQQNRRC
jgi:hypothetical protein